MNPTSAEQYRLLCAQLHDEACAKKQDFYLDPATGYQVMTAYYLSARGTCCESVCRHCPYGFKAPIR